jgi:HPt (histidine-containing phosphotransfer) domain-containing protein
VSLQIDKAGILENFMDDEELLFESIDLFLERAAGRLETLEKAVTDKNVEGVMAEGHTLKGMVGIFSTGEAFESAKKLEFMGREKNLTGVEDALKDFALKLNELCDALKAWRQEAS